MMSFPYQQNRYQINDQVKIQPESLKFQGYRQEQKPEKSHSNESYGIQSNRYDTALSAGFVKNGTTKHSSRPNPSETWHSQSGINTIQKEEEPFYKNLYHEEKLKLAESLFSRNVSTVNCARQLQLYQKTVQKMKAEYQTHGRVLRDGQQQKLEEKKKAQENAQIRRIIAEIMMFNQNLGVRGIRNQLQKLGIRKELTELSMYMHEISSRSQISQIKKNDVREKILQTQQSSFLMYCRTIGDIALQRLIFIDETTFEQSSQLLKNPNQHQQKLPTGSSRQKQAEQSQNATTFTLIVAASVRGFEATKLVDRKLRVEDVLDFLSNDLEKLPSQSVVVLDNAKVHHLEEVKSTLKALNLNVCYLPYQTPQLPQLNPLQSILSDIRFQFLTQKDCFHMDWSEIQRLVTVSARKIEIKAFPDKFKQYQQTLRKKANSNHLLFNSDSR